VRTSLDIQPEGQLEENKPCSGARKTRRTSLKEPMRRESSSEDAGKVSQRVGPSSRTSREELEGEDNDKTRQIVAPADQVLTSRGELETPSSETSLMKESRDMEGDIERNSEAKDKPLELKSVETTDKTMKKECGDETTESAASPRELRRRKTTKDSPLAVGKLKTAVKAEDSGQPDNKEEKAELRTRAGKSQQAETEQGRGVAIKRKAAADDATTNESPAIRTRLRGHAEDGESVSPVRETRQGPKKLCQNVKADRPTADRVAKKGDKERTETKKEPSQDSVGLGKKETRLEPSSTAAESERTAVGRETRRSEMLSHATGVVVRETRQSEMVSAATAAVVRETIQSEMLSLATAAVERETRASELSSATAAVVREAGPCELSSPAASVVFETKEIEMLSKDGAALICETKESTLLSLSTGTGSEVRETRQKVSAAADSSLVEGPSLRLRLVKR
jgi:hypothetical protein